MESSVRFKSLSGKSCTATLRQDHEYIGMECDSCGTAFVFERGHPGDARDLMVTAMSRFVLSHIQVHIGPVDDFLEVKAYGG